MFNDLVKQLREKKLKLGTVESMTGGLFAGEITSIPGASDVFKGGLVTYATETKVSLLNIGLATINEYGVVSKQIAEEMAIQGQKLIQSDVVVSFTGNAGPTAMGNEPVGSIYIGIIVKKEIRVHHLTLSGSRQDIRENAVNYAALKLLDMLNEMK